MAVENHPVHPMTMRAAGHIYKACQNKPMRSPEWFVMSTACRYDRSDIDEGCKGCTQPKDTEYLERMKEVM